MPSKSLENMELLLEAGRLLSSKLELPDLLHTIMSMASQVVNAETASLLLVDPETDELYFDVALGLDPKLTQTRLKMGQGIAGAVAQSSKPLIINDVSKDPRWSAGMDLRSGFVTRSILAVPLLLKGKRIGVVEAINHVQGGFSETDLRTFEAFASQAAVAIENARLFASLNEEKAKLNTLFNEMRDAAVLVDARGKILLANETARKFFLIGSQSPPDNVQEATKDLRLTPSLEQILGSDQNLVHFEAIRENPKLFILAGTASLIRGSRIGSRDGEPGRVFVFRDVTEEKREEGLKRNFLSLISHKLKTPLSSILGYSQLLLDDFQSANAQESHRKAISAINTQGQKLADLVEKLLNYTTLEEIDSARIVAKEFAVDEMIEKVISSMKSWLEGKNACARLKAKSNLRALGDPSLLLDVVKNLIENGVKFSPSEPKEVTLWVSRADGFAEIHVQDQGPGIPPEEQDKIFAKFYQVESSFTGQVEGWGLGLSFVQKVIEKHGGTIRLQSKINSGTTVTITLPLSRT